MKNLTQFGRAGLAAAILMVAACSDDPSPDPPPPAICTEPSPDFNRLEYDALKARQIPQDLQQQYPRIFENGALKPWEALTSGIKVSEMELNFTAITEVLGAVDGQDHVGHRAREDYWNEYDRLCR